MEISNVVVVLAVLLIGCCYCGAKGVEKCYFCMDGADMMECKDKDKIQKLVCEGAGEFHCFGGVSDKGEEMRGCISKDYNCDNAKDNPEYSKVKIKDCYVCEKDLCNDKKASGSEKIHCSSLTFVTALVFVVVYVI